MAKDLRLYELKTEDSLPVPDDHFADIAPERHGNESCSCGDHFRIEGRVDTKDRYKLFPLRCLLNSLGQ